MEVLLHHIFSDDRSKVKVDGCFAAWGAVCSQLPLFRSDSDLYMSHTLGFLRVVTFSGSAMHLRFTVNRESPALQTGAFSLRRKKVRSSVSEGVHSSTRCPELFSIWKIGKLVSHKQMINFEGHPT